MLWWILACGGATELTDGSTPSDGPKLITEFNLAVTADPDPVVAGTPSELWYSFTDQDDEPIDTLQQNHHRMVHVLMISEDLSSFQHVHHEDYYEVTTDVLKTATYHIPATLPYAGNYLVAFDYAYANAYLQTTYDLAVTGEPPMPWPEPDSDTLVEVPGYVATLSFETPPVAGFEAHWSVHVETDAGEPVTDIVQWLGADAHCVIAASDLAFIQHTHAYVAGMEAVPPDHDMPHEHDGPDIPFRMTLPVAGRYAMWAQFARTDAPDDPITLPFQFVVSP